MYHFKAYLHARFPTSWGCLGLSLWNTVVAYLSLGLGSIFGRLGMALFDFWSFWRGLRGVLGDLLGVLRALGPLLGDLGSVLTDLGRSWAALGGSWADLGRS